MPSEYRQRTGRFCSKKCEGVSRRKPFEIKKIRKPQSFSEVVCCNCSKTFTKRTDHVTANNYCGRKCFGLANRAENPISEDKEYQKKYMQIYVVQNKEKLNENRRKWNDKNKAKKLGIQRKYRQSHKDFLAASMRARRFGLKASAFTPNEWDAMKQFYDYKCLCCGRQEPEIKLTVDHIIPFILGGQHSADNIQPLCRSCNSSKSIKATDYRPKEKANV